jgi:glyoxylase-like metal-dependent hydrolase (beta-lactamase superfamily II)
MLLDKRRIRGAFLTTLATLLGTISYPAATYAAAPQVRSQAPGFYRMMLGTIEVTALSDGTHPFPVDTVMRHVSPKRIATSLKEEELSLPLQGSINAYLVNTGDKLILIDSGAGALYGGCCGRLLANLRAAGYRPEQVDEVLLTHLHKDHVGGVSHDGAMVFPNAVLRTTQAEADYWLTAANRRAAPAFLATFFDSAAASVAPYIAAGRFKPFAGEQQIAPGIRTRTAPGHTAGHAVYFIESGAQTLLIWGDIVHVAAVQLQTPSATVKYDTDAVAAQQSRRDLLELAASRHLIVAAAHIAFPGLGHVRRNGRSWDWLPLNYEGEPSPP